MSKSGARILVVDDENEILRALQRSLTAHGFDVFTASTGEEALESIAHYRPDLMLLDLGLPGISGLEVCKRVRAQSNLPIIVLSVKDTERDKVLALDLGADDYVSKPFGMNEVLARIRVALRHTAQVESGTEPIFTAVEALMTLSAPKPRVILMCPQGEPYTQRKAEQLAEESHLIFICGHYEGFDRAGLGSSTYSQFYLDKRKGNQIGSVVVPKYQSAKGNHPRRRNICRVT